MTQASVCKDNYAHSVNSILYSDWAGSVWVLDHRTNNIHISRYRGVAEGEKEGLTQIESGI